MSEGVSAWSIFALAKEQIDRAEDRVRGHDDDVENDEGFRAEVTPHTET